MKSKAILSGMKCMVKNNNSSTQTKYKIYIYALPLRPNVTLLLLSLLQVFFHWGWFLDGFMESQLCQNRIVCIHPCCK